MEKWISGDWKVGVSQQTGKVGGKMQVMFSDVDEYRNV